MHPPSNRPAAIAWIKGGTQVPELSGSVEFFQTNRGVLVIAELHQLPVSSSNIFALHIHAGESCDGLNFSETGGHYNPVNLPHPLHAGDLPPLFSCHGYAFMAVLTDRFQISDVIGRTIVIHGGTDDFISQPAGNAGNKIACGVIRTNS